MYFQDLILTLQNHWAKQGCIIAQPLRPRGRRRHHAPDHLPPRARARAVERGLRAALAPPRRRPLRREPEPPVPAPPVPGDPQARAARTCRSSTCESLRGDRHRPARARPALRRGRLGVAHARRLGPGLGGVVRRAWRSPSSPTSSSAAASSCKPVAAELTYGLERICMYLQNVENVYDIEWVKGVKYREVFHAERGGDEQVRAARVGPADALRAVRRVREGVQAADRAPSCRCPRTTTRSSARTRSTCSTPAAPSRSPSARASSSACATTRGCARRATCRCASGWATRC